MRELEGREAQFRVVQDKGESLIMDRHPAPKLIEVRPASLLNSSKLPKPGCHYETICLTCVMICLVVVELHSCHDGYDLIDSCRRTWWLCRRSGPGWDS